MKYCLLQTSCKPRKFSQPASQQKKPLAGSSRRRKQYYSIESERGREADWRRTNQEKDSRLKKKAKIKQTIEAAQKEQKQKVVVPGTAAQKADEIRRKIESGSTEQLRVAERRQEKKVERKSKKQTGEDRVKQNCMRQNLHKQKQNE